MKNDGKLFFMQLFSLSLSCGRKNENLHKTVGREKFSVVFRKGFFFVDAAKKDVIFFQKIKII